MNNFFKVLGMVGMVSEELAKAAADNTITIRELLTISLKIAEALDIEVDTTGIDISDIQ